MTARAGVVASVRGCRLVACDLLVDPLGYSSTGVLRLALVEQRHGYVEVGCVDEITTRMLGPDEARTLALDAGAPVLVYVRTSYTDSRPLRSVETIFAGDRNRIVSELGDLTAHHDEQQENAS